jgi:hypothetical protein
MRTPTIHRTDVLPAATAATLSLLAVALRWRGGDWPAQLLRLELVERDGPAVWNNLWFAGHHTPGYGFLFPILAAVLGVATVAIASCVVAAACFHLLTRGSNRRRALVASVLFAAGTVANVAIGRLTFALGLAVALAALAAVQRGRRGLAAVLAVCTAPASPVAAAMLALALAALALHSGRRRLLGLAALAATPVAAAAVLFPQGGRFPFLPGAFAWSVAVAAVVTLATRARAVRVGAALYAAACVGAFLIPNPLGANATRLGMFFAAPVLVLTARRIRSPLAVATLAAMLWWQWSPALDGIARAGLDPSSDAAYHDPLIAAVRRFGGGDERIEVVPTQRHWETVYVASELPLARGWERQLDIGRNAIFYGDRLDADTYHRWLRDNAVAFVALADAPVDPSARAEAELLGRRLPFLESVWHDDHWQLWRVTDARPIVAGPARLVRLGPTTIVLDVVAAEPVLLRVRYSSHWSLDQPGCVEPTADGWTIVRPQRPGRVTMRAVLARSLPVIGPLDACAR